MTNFLFLFAYIIIGDFMVSHGGGKGVGGPPQRSGGREFCVCPKCGYKKPHEFGVPCIKTTCPQCGTRMIGQ